MTSRYLKETKMLKRVMSIVIFLVTTSAYAETVLLVCRDKFDATVSLAINADARTVSIGGVPAINVFFTPSTASFEAGSYKHMLDRVSGVMYVEKKNSKELSPFHCKLSAPLF
jgi:hypothetical protein